MTKEQAEKLYTLQSRGYFVFCHTSPYVASVDMASIEPDGDHYSYSDSALSNMPMANHDPSEFTVYQSFDHPFADLIDGGIE